MKRALIGSLIFGTILAILPGSRSFAACVCGGFLAAYLLNQLGARPITEKTGALMTAGLLAWLAGPEPSRGTGFLAYLTGWLAASAALSAFLHPRSE